MTTAPVLFSLEPMADGFFLGVAQLNLPGSLNALNLEMVQLLNEKLLEWQNDVNVAAVFLYGAGEKAFCAGGDVVSLYNAMKAEPGVVPDSVETFFTQEYKLDYLIHKFSKPIVVWGGGFIMGGGIGLFAGASHKVVTDTSRLAMPEITIGLFPDVGGSYFLNQLPHNYGTFLGLTGVQFNGADAMYIGMADHLIPGLPAEQAISEIKKLSIADNSHAALTKLLNMLAAGNQDKVPESNIQKFDTRIKAAVCQSNLSGVVEDIVSWQSSDDKWLSRAAKTLRNGSPVTQRLVWEQLRRGKGLSLEACFRMELIMACRCASAGEFQEGVRALLIEKDGAPNWLYNSHIDIPEEFLESFFTNHWTQASHPLAQLGE